MEGFKKDSNVDRLHGGMEHISVGLILSLASQRGMKKRKFPSEEREEDTLFFSMLQTHLSRGTWGGSVG